MFIQFNKIKLQQTPKIYSRRKKMSNTILYYEKYIMISGIIMTLGDERRVSVLLGKRQVVSCGSMYFFLILHFTL